ncbi:unnamed protein product [Hymenolepis diminuta]|uniref:FHA domain-containing protein n=1 Tax=Hymenolepis diminuta TaxID=6216 RepID=A0A564XVF3_HYMDI|nr:unnamed protein product [Hymenolepis diminuta]
MWIVTKKNDASYKRLLLTNHEYTVGRAETDFIILDRSVSRLHAKIFISYPEEGVDNALILPVMKVTDLSRFGTFLNTTRLYSNISTEIPPNSEITFGVQSGFTLLVEFFPLNILLSSVSPKIKSELRPEICSLGGKILSEWTEECNLLVMSRLIVTHKVLCCLLRGIDVVTPEYLNALKNSHSNKNFSYPDPSMYMPRIEEKGFSNADSPKFRANPNRYHVFTGKTFIFLSETKFQRFNLLLNLSSAKSFCVPEKLSLSRKYFMDLFGSNSDPCLVYESESVNSRHDLAYSVLEENFNRRPILDQEISLAIIDSSCEVYCNATRSCPIVSDIKSLNTSSEYSSCNVESYNSVISRRASLFKRPRVDSSDGNTETGLLESASKRHCRRTPLLPPSTRSANPTKKLSRILVPDTEQTNTQTNPLTTHNSPIKEEMEKKEKQPSVRASFAPKIPFGVNQNENIRIGSEEEKNEDGSILDAFDSLPPFVSKLKKKKAYSQVEKSASKTLCDIPNEEYNTGKKFDFDGDEVTEDDSILGAFDSMPSFSSILKKKTTPQLEKSPIIDIETSVGKESVARNNTTLKPCNEVSILSPQIKRSPLTRRNYEFSADDKLLQNPPTSTDGFLSKQLGQKMMIRIGASKEFKSANEESVIVPIKLYPLIKNTSGCYPNRPRILPDRSPANFKRFVKVRG